MGWFIEWWQGIGLVGQIMACMAIPTSIVLILQAILMLIGAGFGGEADGDASDLEADGVDADVSADFDTDGFDADISADFDADGFDADVSADFDADGFDADVSADFDADGFDADISADFDADVSDIGADAHSGLNIGHGFNGISAHAHGIKIFTVRGIIAFFAIGGWAGLAAITAGIRPVWSVQIALLSGVAAMILASVVIRFALKMQSSGNIDLRNALSQTAEVYITIPPSRSNTGKVTMLLQERFVEIDAITDSAEAIRPYTQVEIVGLKDRDCLIVRPNYEQQETKHD